MWQDTSNTAIPELEGIKPDITLYDNVNGNGYFPHLIGAFIELKKKGHIYDASAQKQLFSRLALYMLTYHRFFI